MASKFTALTAPDNDDDNDNEIIPTSQMPIQFFTDDDDAELAAIQKQVSRNAKMAKAQLKNRVQHQAIAELAQELKSQKRDENWETILATAHTGMAAIAPSGIKMGMLEGTQHLTHGMYQPPMLAVNGVTLVLAFMLSPMLVRKRGHALAGLLAGTIYAATGR
jgi:hypothetical protein